MRKNYKDECKQIKQDSEYTAEAHHIIAARHKKTAILVQVVPAIVSALLGTLVAGKVVPLWIGWLVVISAVISAVGNVLDPNKSYYEHLNAAKHFTALKHEARALSETIGRNMSVQEFALAVKNLHARYTDLIKFVPPTDEKSFGEAKKRIKSGVHKPD